MRIFVTGASGHLGSALVPELLQAGHDVVGLVRSATSAAALEAAGAHARRGDLGDLDGLRNAAQVSDAVIHLAFDHDAMKAGDMVGAASSDLRAVAALAAGLDGSDNPLVTTSPIMLLAFSNLPGQPYTEDDVLAGGPRIDTENATIALADRGIRASVVRLPPIVHSDDDGPHGFIPTMVRGARAAGAAGYVGDGTNAWPAVHTRDAARLYRLAAENAPAGQRLHAVAEEAVATRSIAEAIGRGLSVPTDVVDPDATTERFGFVARFISQDAPTSSALTRGLLGWTPTEIGLIADLDAGHYFREHAHAS